MGIVSCHTRRHTCHMSAVHTQQRLAGPVGYCRSKRTLTEPGSGEALWRLPGLGGVNQPGQREGWIGRAGPGQGAGESAP